MSNQDRVSPTSDAMPTVSPTGDGITAPPNPLCPEQVLAPFRASLTPPRAHHLRPGSVHEIDIAETTISIHPDLPAVPAWGFGVAGHIVSPGPLLEASAGHEALVRWRNRLPASVRPSMPARLPIATAVVVDPHGDVDSRGLHSTPRRCTRSADTFSPSSTPTVRSRVTSRSSTPPPGSCGSGTVATGDSVWRDISNPSTVRRSDR